MNAFKSTWAQGHIYRRKLPSGKFTSRNLWDFVFSRHRYYPPSPRRILVFQGSLFGFNFWLRLGRTH